MKTLKSESERKFESEKEKEYDNFIETSERGEAKGGEERRGATLILLSIYRIDIYQWEVNSFMTVEEFYSIDKSKIVDTTYHHLLPLALRFPKCSVTSNPFTSRCCHISKKQRCMRLVLNEGDHMIGGNRRCLEAYTSQKKKS